MLVDLKWRYEGACVEGLWVVKIATGRDGDREAPGNDTYYLDGWRKRDDGVVTLGEQR